MSDFKIPELGENVTAGDVVRVLVNVGDTLAKDQPVLELETDKATIEVPSNVAGTVKEIKVKPGDKVKVGQLVLTVDEQGAEAAPATGGKRDTKPAPDQGEARQGGGEARQDRVEEPVPSEPREGRVEGAKEQPTAAAEEGGLSQKAAAEPQPADGGAERGAAERGRGEVEGPDVQTPDDPPRQRRGEVVDISRGARAPQPAPAPEGDAPPAPAAPSVRRMARELGVDIRNVTGSGEGGRISIEDLQEYVKGVMSGATSVSAAVAGAGPAAAPLPDFTKWGEVERKPMSNIRRKTAEHLGHAWSVIPHVTQHDRADITSLEALRKQYSPQAEKAGGKLTMTAIALKVVAGALKKFPQFNSSVDAARNEIVFKKSIHVGVAVDTERGLLVPVIRDVDRKGIFELSAELAKASEKARGGKLSLDEMQGGGMTITNLGGIGGTSFTPIVNWPEVAILGVSRGAFEPVWNGSSFEPRLMLPLSLSYDHRVIDGADAARFLRWVCEAFEQPFVLAL
ncbi:MAG TPA: 2-oxo acid dehydrogenase subunit E2 [Vicinamibacterales bacterium]|nr:2-oxo acid dehydrogenase subunit E2 [Vicinamibacterales bacterium]